VKRLYSTILLVLAVVILSAISSCKKLTYADLSSAQDAVNVGFHINAIMDDAANVISRNASLSGSTPAANMVTGGTVVIDSVHGTATITYDGSTVVDSRFVRSGSMTIQLVGYSGVTGTHWIDQNAQMTIYFHNLKFKNVYSYNGGAPSNHTYTYQGANTLINTSGGLAYQMMAGLPAAVNLGAIQYKLISTGDSVTFYDDTLRVWGFNRLRTYTNRGGIAYITVSANLSLGGYTAVDMWGTDHTGNGFYESFIQGMTFDTLNCSDNFRDARIGEAKVYEQQFGIDMVFGATSPTGGNIAFNCPYGFKTTYENSRNNLIEAESPYWY
jgi:hypothetical protein